MHALPSLVDINIPEGRHLTVCGDVYGQLKFKQLANPCGGASAICRKASVVRGGAELGRSMFGNQPCAKVSTGGTSTIRGAKLFSDQPCGNV
ncbi:serine/threonine-protein phosphatase 5-like [Cucumis melo var. makuwa]|uniref:Serine/threonine-protein phosphatase 5-like n=1 Tax=Cucumis melo var. makuwa TaxID=1194695 RepID=A0A5A7TC82_CUCMM|nr:serine/threonine-protein phosphatase 5-like [Cucumis melo var. makuwa]